MNKVVSTGRLANSILCRAVSYNFCIGFAPLDPRKHTTMTHNNNNMYLDLWEFGQYPDWVHICSVPARTYEPQLLATLANTLNTRYNTKITPQYLLAHKHRQWNRFLHKDLKLNAQFHEVYPVLLGKLATSIFVKQSRLTWILEQQARFAYTIASFDSDIPATVGDFIDRYHEDIEALVLSSNFGFAAEIDQPESSLEKHEFEQHFNGAFGVKELKNLDPAHNNFINRLLSFIH